MVRSSKVCVGKHCADDKGTVDKSRVFKLKIKWLNNQHFFLLIISLFKMSLKLSISTETFYRDKFFSSIAQPLPTADFSP